MVNLNRNNSNWSFEERRKINENWSILESMANSTASGNNGLKQDVEQIKITVSESNARSKNALQKANEAIFITANFLEITADAIKATTDATKATTDAKKATTDAVNSTTNAIASTRAANNAAQRAETIATNIEGYDRSIVPFSINTTFLKHQHARFNGSTYQAKLETTGNPLPTTPNTENDWWVLTAQRGVDGSGAVASVNGILPNSDGDIILPSREEITKLVSHQFKIPATANGQTQIAIPLGGFNKLSDTLILFKNTATLLPDSYTVNGNIITLAEPVVNAANTTFHIIILRTVLTDEVSSAAQQQLDMLTMKLGHITIDALELDENIEIGLKVALELPVAADVLIPSGTYNINAPLTATLQTKKRIVSSGKVVLVYEGNSNSEMFDLTLNGNDLEIIGDITFDANSKASDSLRITNGSSVGSTPAKVHMENVTVLNAYSSTVGKASNGIYLRGGFEQIKLDRCTINNISRALGVGVSGVQGTAGVTVTHFGIEAYAKSVVINDIAVSNIQSQELDEGANNVDMDGLAIFAPPASENNNIPLDAILTVNGGIFEDCKGRSIKSQMPTNTVDGTTFIRGKFRTITNGCEIDFQYGVGVIRNIKCRYHTLSDGSNVFGSSFSTIRSTPSVEGYTLVDGVEVINNVPVNVGRPYFMLTSVTSENIYSSVIIKNSAILGVGAIRSLFRGNFSRVRQLTVNDNFIRRISDALIDNGSNDGSSFRINVNNNNHTATTLVPLVRSNGTVNSLVSGQGNFGFEESLDSVRRNTVSEGLRTAKLVAKNADQSGTFAIEAYAIPAGGTRIFAPRGNGSNIGVYFITTTWVASAQGMFVAYGNTINPIQADVSTTLAYGNGSDPNVTNKINVWATDQGIHVKNTSTSSRTVTLASIG